ncbi:MAG: 4Fe-4S binding protein [Melioribacteraceae bacterium]|nr:4Fe-4S binding protein [Melioribacteraceae bacterium]MCF8265882.1 4Fe-4S binding protein [Melioribacteraceae bacterium]MCF8413431.1 4Fe-4S binding protein [Melioribacteraceae bacterium]
MISVNKEYCPQNHKCPVINYCPVDAIIQDSPFTAPRIDEQKCVKCGKCTKACFVFSCDDCSGK